MIPHYILPKLIECFDTYESLISVLVFLKGHHKDLKLKSAEKYLIGETYNLYSKNDDYELIDINLKFFTYDYQKENILKYGFVVSEDYEYFNQDFEYLPEEEIFYISIDTSDNDTYIYVPDFIFDLRVDACTYHMADKIIFNGGVNLNTLFIKNNRSGYVERLRHSGYLIFVKLYLESEHTDIKLGENIHKIDF